MRQKEAACIYIIGQRSRPERV